MRWTSNTLLRMGGTLAIGALGGAVAQLFGFPLPWLLGSQIALCVAALCKLELFGGPMQWPRGSRLIFLPVIGVMIGSSFTAQVLSQMPSWWPLLLVISGFLLFVHLLVFLAFRRWGGLDVATAFFASFPGGFVEAIVLGQEAGGDEQMITIQHFLRISLIVLILPLVFWAISGSVVGSAAGVQLGSVEPLTIPSALVLLAAGMAGTLAARWMHIPAADISGAVFASAGVHLMGWVDGQVPSVLVAITQLVVGTSLGVGFVGVTLRQLGRSLGLAVVAFVVVFGCGVLTALVVGNLLNLPFSALLLALAPGGLAEMSLVAVSLGLSVPLVTLAHLYRICFTVLVLPRIYAPVSRAFG